MIKKMYEVWLEIARRMRKQNISAFAASSAFFFFLSLGPILILLCMMLPFTPLTEGNLLTWVNGLTPQKFDILAEELISNIYDKSAELLSIAAVTAVWSAGKGILALMRGLNAVNSVDEKRNYFVVRVIASFYTLIMLIGVLLSLFVMVFGKQLVALLIDQLPRLHILFDLLIRFRFLFVWFVLTVFFAAIYTFLPDERRSFRKQLPGAIIAAVAWSFFSWGFAQYTAHIDNGVYGSLSVIILVMIWMYFCMYIILIGAYLNKLYYNWISTIS